MAPKRIFVYKILNRLDVESNRDGILDLVKIYEREFPDQDEREPFEAILNRVKGERSAVDPCTFILICEREDPNQVIGGAVCDYYLKSRSVHLTYIFVSTGHRHSGAWPEIKRAIGDTIHLLEELHSVEFNYLFFEANIPEKTTLDSLDPLSRLKIFSKSNAFIVDLPYFQPALSKDSNVVGNLYLLCIPRNENTSLHINRNVVFDFLFELYQSLNIENPLDDDSYKHMLDYVDQSKDPQTIPLRRISDVINTAKRVDP